jgi:hypothetical protein
MINLSQSESLTEVNGKMGLNPILIWYTDGSKTYKGTEPGVNDHGTRQKLGFSLGQYIAIFHAKAHAIKARAVENLDRNYRNRNIV